MTPQNCSWKNFDRRRQNDEQVKKRLSKTLARILESPVVTRFPHDGSKVSAVYAGNAFYSILGRCFVS